MKYFGLFTYGFGFLGSVFFLFWGILLIAAPERALSICRLFLGKRKLSLYADRLRNVSRISNAVFGFCNIAFGALLLQSLIRSLIHVYSR
jgi:hypothetical protein